MNWLFIQTLPCLNNSGSWMARWRWDDKWAVGRTRRQAILNLKENSIC